MRGLKSLHERFASRGLTVVIVSVGESKEFVRAWVAGQGLRVACAVNEEQTADLYKFVKAPGFPFFCLVDRRGRISALRRGMMGWPGIERRVETTLAKGAR